MHATLSHCCASRVSLQEFPNEAERLQKRLLLSEFQYPPVTEGKSIEQPQALIQVGKFRGGNVSFRGLFMVDMSVEYALRVGKSEILDIVRLALNGMTNLSVAYVQCTPTVRAA